MSEPVQVGAQVPRKLAILPLRNRVLLPGAILRIRCTSASSVRLVEQELWQKEPRNLVGVVPVRDNLSHEVGLPDTLSPLLAPNGSRAGADSSGRGPHGKHDKEVVDDRESSSSSSADFQQPLGKLLTTEDNYIWHSRGVAARALHVSRGVEKPSGRITYTVILEGVCRIGVLDMNARGPFHSARIAQLDLLPLEEEQARSDEEVQALATQFKSVAAELLAAFEHRERRVGGVRALLQSLAAHRLADLLVASIESSYADRLAMLDAVAPRARLLQGIRLISAHLAALRGGDKQQQPALPPPAIVVPPSFAPNVDPPRPLQAAPKGITDDGGDDEDDVAALERRMEAAGMPANVRKHVNRELRRLRKMQTQSPGYSSARQYLELLADLPWAVSSSSSSEMEIDLAAAKDKLDSQHFGLSKVKTRIIEYIAVRKLKPDATGPVLCFVGPPGVGKTSLAASIAAVLGRKYVRIALGGVKDEADIRGHRRTYVGSMPGRLVEGIKRVGVNNPVMLLDEIDKTGGDTRGDPAAALLEVLDPEQNKHFTDHYVNVPFDLSKVVFVATANRAGPIPAPLLDRMEVIELPGYTPEEKQRIALRHLIPRTLDQHGITERHLHIPEHVVEHLIQRYTREAGVRNLARHLAALARAAAVKVAESWHSQNLTRQIKPLSPRGGEAADGLTSVMEGEGEGEGAEAEMEVEAVGLQGQLVAAAMAEARPIVVDEAMLETVLGPPRFDGKEAAERVSTPGVAVGLVWTAVGGEVQFVEATSMLGKGDLHLTGQLGEVIKESAQIALTWVRARAADLSLVQQQQVGEQAGNLMGNRDIHIHFPAGAVPKDGPSAGVTLVTALVSLLTKRCVRADTAMTGELTLRGLCLPVGGIKEKILAAHRCGIRRVILPEKNLKDLQEVPAAILACMEILPTSRVEEVLKEAFDGGCPVTPKSRL
eukprot:jgi/Mesen1/9992/ME000072S09407